MRLPSSQVTHFCAAAHLYNHLDDEAGIPQRILESMLDHSLHFVVRLAHGRICCTYLSGNTRSDQDIYSHAESIHCDVPSIQKS